MFSSRDDSSTSSRWLFADQFEPYGTDFVYRRSQKGPAIRVSSSERDRFVQDFDKRLSRATWIICIGMSIVLAAILLLLLRTGSDLSEAVMFAGIGAAMIPYFAYYRWAWAAPARELANRIPIAGERSPEDVRRLRFARMTYGQLAGAAFAGLVIPFIGSSHEDLFSGWNRLWLVFGGAVVLFAAVQAFRKWQFEQEDSYRNVIPRSLAPPIAESPDDPSSPVTGQLWRFLPFAVLVVAFAFLGFTPAGKELARDPNFWPLVFPLIMIVCGGWSLFTVARGFTKGRIEPFARGFYTTYFRETQPKRFWASMGWNSILGCFCLWLAFQSNTTAEPLEVRCSNDSQTYSPEEVLSACNQLVQRQPNNADAYLNRGLIYLDNMKADQAVADFTRAHELDPQSVWPIADRGISYAWKGDRERAEKDFAVARKIDPLNPVLLRGQALVDMEAGDLEAAIAGLTKQLARDPTDGWSLMMRADAYQQRGDFEKARADRNKFSDLSKANKTPPPRQS